MRPDEDDPRYAETVARFQRIQARKQGGPSAQNGHTMPQLDPAELAVVAPVAQNGLKDTEQPARMPKRGAGRSTLRFLRERRYEWLRKHQYGLRRSAVYVAEELVRKGGQRGYSGTQTALGQALGMHRQHIRRALDELVVAGFVSEHHRKNRKSAFFRFRV